MQIEQLPPKKPRFLLVVLAFGGTLIVIFILAYLILHFGGYHLLPRHHSTHPASQLVQPTDTGVTLA
jgi:hypothetical protein